MCLYLILEKMHSYLTYSVEVQYLIRYNRKKGKTEMVEIEKQFALCSDG